jgi:fatty-acyl-CoA synthase
MWYWAFSFLYKMIRAALPLARYSKKPFPALNIWVATAKKKGDAIAMVDAITGATLTFKQTNVLANRVATWALAEGLTDQKCVAFMAENRIEYFPFWCGVGKVGGVTALINTNLRSDALLHAIQACNASVVVATPECMDALEEIQSKLPMKKFVFCSAEGRKGWEHLDPILSTCSEEEPPAPTNFKVSDTLLFIYTSGTTGMPKAAKITNVRFRMALGGEKIIGVKASDTVYCCLPLYHTAGLMTESFMISKGCKLVIRRKFSASNFWTDCITHKVTVFQYIGELLRYLNNTAPAPHDTEHSVRMCVGNGLRPDVWDAFQPRFKIKMILEGYGATEGNVMLANVFGSRHAIGYLPTFPWPFTALSPSRLRAYPVQMIKHDSETELPIRNAQGFCTSFNVDEPAELIGAIGDHALKKFDGYADKAATEKKVLTDVFKKGDRYFRTGDLVKMDKRGFVFFVDRIGDTFRWKGENVATMQVAQPCTSITGVLEANVYGVPLPGAEGKAGMAGFILAEGATLNPKEAYSVLSRELPLYAVPIFIRILQEMDMTGTFKHKKGDLQKAGLETSDIVYVINHKNKTYDILTPAVKESIVKGLTRF